MNKQLAYFNIFFCSALAFSLPVWAADTAFAKQEEIETLFGTACERVKAHETKASIRLRATDKATFEAVRSLNDISSLQNTLDSHDLNVLVYDIVDNYVEDLGVQTTQQDEQKICVEITGYVQRDNVLASIAKLKDAPDENAAQTPAPEPEPTPQTQEATSLPQTSQNIATENTVLAPVENLADDAQNTAIADDGQKKFLYIAPLEFYNNTQSAEYAKILNTVFEKNPYFVLTNNKNNADYIITSKVLRAKVDPINSNTNRMQMVIAVGAHLVGGDFSVTEHQNRFILFASSDDEQKVAAQLMQKLLTKAASLILKKVEKNAQIIIEENDSALITPEKS